MRLKSTIFDRRLVVTTEQLVRGSVRRSRRFVYQHGAKRSALQLAKVPVLVGRQLAGKNRPQQATEADDEFDRRYGTDTGNGDGELSNLASTPEATWLHGNKYEGVPVDVFEQIMAALDIRFEDYTFVDYGSGKGKALLLAASRPFKAVVGVEYSERLHEIAERNVGSFAANGGRAAAPITSVCADATTFALPDGPLVLYLYNSFDGEIVRRVVDNIVQELSAAPRPLLFLYLNAIHAELLRAAGFSERQRWDVRGKTHLLFDAPGAV